MCEISGIKTIVNDVINAIHSVINVEVTVINKEGERVAATGKYTADIGKKIAEGSAFSVAINSGMAFIIEKPGEETVCLECSRRHSCEEFAEVCSPIIVEGEILGIIGLIAFDEEQKESIMNNKKNLLNFLNRMADLIATKVIEERQRKCLERNTKEISILMDYLDDGVLSINKAGEIQKFNCQANKLLGLDYLKIKNIRDLHSDDEVKDILNVKGGFIGKESIIRSGNKETRVVFGAKPIMIDGEVHEILITYKRTEDLLSVMNEMIGVKVKTTFDDIIGESKVFVEVKDFAKKAARSASTILIRGGSGTGKELFARAIHFESPRRNQPFIPINCAAIPENLLESELFGYEDGAFTGAKKGGQIGKFELAHGGTIFLDEIGDMSLHLQAKLLRVLQEGVIERIGGKKYLPVDIRVIAATHRDLDKMILNGEFREDLFYRLNVIPIIIPSLKERIDDIPRLMDNFLQKFNVNFKDVKVQAVKGFEVDALEVLEAYSWNGNVRELENTIEYAVNACEGELIAVSDLPNKFREKPMGCCEILPLKEIEKRMILRALSKFGRDKEGIKAVIEVLGVSRATLYRKIKEYEL